MYQASFCLTGYNLTQSFPPKSVNPIPNEAAKSCSHNLGQPQNLYAKAQYWCSKCVFGNCFWTPKSWFELHKQFFGFWSCLGPVYFWPAYLDKLVWETGFWETPIWSFSNQLISDKLVSEDESLIDEDNCHQNQEASSSNFSTSSSSRMNHIRDRIRDRVVEHLWYN